MYEMSATLCVQLVILSSQLFSYWKLHILLIALESWIINPLVDTELSVYSSAVHFHLFVF